MLNDAQKALLESYLQITLVAALAEPTIDVASRFAAYQSVWQLYQSNNRDYLRHYIDDFNRLLLPIYKEIHDKHQHLTSLLHDFIEIYDHPRPESADKLNLSKKDVYDVEPVCKQDVIDYLKERVKEEMDLAMHAFKQECDAHQNKIDRNAGDASHSSSVSAVKSSSKIFRKLGIFNKKTTQTSTNQACAVEKKQPESDVDLEMTMLTLSDYRPSQVALPTAVVIRPLCAPTDTLNVCVLHDSFSIGMRYANVSLPKFLKQYATNPALALTKKWEVNCIDVSELTAADKHNMAPQSLAHIQSADIILFFQQGQLLQSAFDCTEKMTADDRPFYKYLTQISYKGAQAQHDLVPADKQPMPKHIEDATPEQAFNISNALCKQCEIGSAPVLAPRHKALNV